MNEVITDDGIREEELSPREAALRFENLLQRAGLVKVELELFLMNERMQGRFNEAEFEEWCEGGIADEDLRQDRLELYREIAAARGAFEGCVEIAREAVA